MGGALPLVIPRPPAAASRAPPQEQFNGPSGASPGSNLHPGGGACHDSEVPGLFSAGQTRWLLWRSLALWGVVLCLTILLTAGVPLSVKTGHTNPIKANVSTT